MGSTDSKRIVRRVAAYIWGMLPIIAILAVIGVLGAMIAAKSERLDALKQGLATLEAKRLAAEQRDRVVSVVAASADAGAAEERLAEALALDADQAKTVVHMPLKELTGAEQERIGRQIAYIREQIDAHKLDTAPKQPDVNVVVMEVTPGPISERLNLPATAAPWVKYDVIAEVRGEVMERPLKKGSSVRAGQVIAVLDKRDYQIAVKAAQADYETALASKKRLEELYSKQFAARSQLDDITARTEGYRAELEKARLNLERCTITSPIDGVVNQIYVEKGQYANIGEPIAEVMRLDRIKVRVGIPESDVNAVAGVDAYDVKFDALGGSVFAAKKHFLSLASDPAARLYDLELEIANPSGRIRPDMFARVEIVKQQIPDGIAVPLYSIISRGDRQVVYVANSSKAHVRPVQTGIQDGWRIQVTEGLQPGDRLIVVGHRRVNDGQPVNIVRRVSDMEQLR